MDYTRPELTAEEKHKAKELAQQTIRKFGFSGMLVAVTGLLIENMKLTKEIQDHRAARGISPLEVYKV
jgi:hypothetical protein